ncbi:hypothetical protein FDC35_05445 [Clostridium botulinum]|nr:hypothetical protein [Clostridium botulinum]NFP00343.1 hypothetical protein [Clostridium botulinum]
MATMKDLITKYVNEINQSTDKYSSVENVKNQINNLTYANGDPISLEDKEQLWCKIEEILLSKTHSLFENQNINYLSAVSAIKKDIQLKKSKNNKEKK